MPMPRRLIGLAVGVVVLSAAVFGGYKKINGAREKAKQDSLTALGKAPAPERPDTAPISFGAGAAIPVVGAEVRRGDLIMWVNGMGQTAAYQQAVIAAEAQGRIARVEVSEGSIVKAGDPLIVLDTTELVFNLQQARNSLKSAEAEYKMRSALEKYVTDPALKIARDSAIRMQSGLVGAELQLKRAELEYSKATTRAPFAGIISNLKVVPGQRVSGEVLTLSSTNPIKVETHVLQNELASIRRGNQARIKFTAYPDSVFYGRVETINPQVDQNRTARVTVTLDNPHGLVFPGMTAQVEIQSITYRDRLLVPRKAILQRSGERDMLLVYQPNRDGAGEGTAEWRYVALGLFNAEFIEILPGTDGSQKLVDPGEVVLVDGHYTIAHQSPIKLVDKLSPTASRPY